MNRSQDTDRSNPISRAFSKFFERGRVGRKDDDMTTPLPRKVATARPATQATPRPMAAAGTTTQAQPTMQPVANVSTPQAAAPTPTATQRTHTVEKGDTLSGIAKKVYGRADQWKLIFDANRGLLDNPDRIYPGQVLKIPDAPKLH